MYPALQIRQVSFPPTLLYALRDEEIRGDYAIWECEKEYSLEPCSCGSQACRGKVTGNDWMIPELQERYKGHFLPFIFRRIAQLNNGV